MSKLFAASLATALLFAPAAFAQPASDEAVKTLWCGLAFTNINETLPPDPPAEMLAVAEPLPAHGVVLMANAEGAYLAAGLTAEAFATARDDLKPQVIAQVSGNGDVAPQFGLDECLALVPGLEAPAAEPMPAPAPAAPAN